MGNNCCQATSEQELIVPAVQEATSKVYKDPAPQAPADAVSVEPTKYADAKPAPAPVEEKSGETAAAVVVDETPKEIPPVPPPVAEVILGEQAEYFKVALTEAGAQPTEKPGKVLKRRPSSENVAHDAYVAKHKEKFDDIIALAAANDWSEVGVEDGVTAYTKVQPGSDIKYFKGVGEVKLDKPGRGALLEFVQTLGAAEQRPLWDAACKTGDLVQSYMPFYRVATVELNGKLGGIIAPRDLMNVGRIRFEPNGGMTMYLCAAEPEISNMMPPAAGTIRTKMIKGGYVLEPTSDPLVYKVSWLGVVDPGGWIPTWLVNLKSKETSYSLGKIMKYMKSDKFVKPAV